MQRSVLQREIGAMFNNNSKTPVATPAIGAAAGNGSKKGMFSVLGTDIVLSGNIHASADLHIDGRVEGDVNCSALVLGTDSRISGNVFAENARIAGNVEGSVSVRQLTIERTARISGDVEYESISIETGATVEGRLKHVSPGSPKSFARSEPIDNTVHLLTLSTVVA